MNKNTDMHIKLSTEQKETLRKRAESVGLSLSSYIVFVLLNTQQKI